MTNEEPNHYTTPCYVTYYDDNNESTHIGNFSDLQLAYLHVKDLIDDPPWFILPWNDTIRKLRENHLKNKHGLDFATHGNLSYTVFYDDGDHDDYADMPGLVG